MSGGILSLQTNLCSWWLVESAGSMHPVGELPILHVARVRGESGAAESLLAWLAIYGIGLGHCRLGAGTRPPFCPVSIRECK